MISYTELFVLNRVLDGEDIFRIPSFSSITNGLQVINSAKQSLKHKGFLKDSMSLTEKGVQLVNLLERYKSATQYFNYQNIWAALLEDGAAITLAESARGEYEISYLLASSILQFIIEKFTFVSTDSELPVASKRVIKPSELFTMYFIDSKSGFLVEGVFAGQRTASYLYFELNEQSYRYNNRTNELVGVNSQTIQNELGELLKLRTVV
jgi:hypothetical protein